MIAIAVIIRGGRIDSIIVVGIIITKVPIP